MADRVWNNGDLKAIFTELVLNFQNGSDNGVTLEAILSKIIAAPATEAKQDTLIAKDFATQTTLAALLAKIIAAPATEAKQDTLIAKDFATQTTLAALLAKIIAAPATEAKQDTGNTSLASLLALQYLPKGNEFYGFSSDITDNAAHDIITAGGANIFNYITAITVTNSHATVGTFVNITNESDVCIWSGYAAAVGGGFTIAFPTPLKPLLANKKIQVVCVTTGANVRVSINGFKGL